MPSVDTITYQSPIGPPCLNGEKVPREIENPLTVNLILKPSNAFVDIYHRVHLVPNDITTLGTMLVLVAIYLVIKEKYAWAALCYVAFYVTDCMDGMKARKFDQSTRFGDLYDHTRDSLGSIGMFIAIMIKCPMNRYWLIGLVALFFSTCVHAGLAEQYQQTCMELDSESNFLRVCMIISNYVSPRRRMDDSDTDFCKRLVQTMRITRFFSDFSFVLVIAVYLLLQSTK